MRKTSKRIGAHTARDEVRTLLWTTLGAIALGCVDNKPHDSSASNWLGCEVENCHDAAAGDTAQPPEGDDPVATPSQVDSGASRPDASAETQAESSTLPSDGPSSVLDAGVVSAEEPPRVTSEADAATDGVASTAEITNSSIDAGQGIETHTNEPVTLSPEDSGVEVPADDSECVGALGEWVELQRPADSWSDLPLNSAAGAIGDHVYVLDVSSARLFDLDTCRVTWNEIDVDWDAALTPEDGAFWSEEMLKFYSNTYTFDPITGAMDPYTRPTRVMLEPLSFVEFGTEQEALFYGARTEKWPYSFWFGGAIVDEQRVQSSGLPWGTVTSLGLWTDCSVPVCVERWVSQVGAPSPRTQATVVPFEDDFMVWGGFGEVVPGGAVPESELRDGAIYHPATDSWTSVTSEGAPSQVIPLDEAQLASASGMAVGDEILIVGTHPDALYNPASDTWRAVEGLDPVEPLAVDVRTTVTPAGNFVTMRYGLSPYILDVSSASVSSLDVDSTPPAFAGVPEEVLTNTLFVINTWANGRRVILDGIGPCDPGASGSCRRLGGGILKIE